MVALTLNRGFVLLGLVVAIFGNVVEGLDCYKCKTNDPNDRCLRKPDSTSRVTTCVGGVNKCVVRLTYNTVNNRMSEFERDCEFNAPIVGDETECRTNGQTRVCQVVCSEDRCNDIDKNDVEQCVTDNCSSASILIVSPLLLIASAAIKMLF
ncbi:uncharacterized protein LOC135462042 [Liolophura sinensis]|uniref:uncharacterized protein LOC135462042 n=1 Tax=Liolophura sinensis TaxID=3198878 RepID=UPI00315928FA